MVGLSPSYKRHRRREITSAPFSSSSPATKVLVGECYETRAINRTQRSYDVPCTQPLLLTTEACSIRDPNNCLYEHALRYDLLGCSDCSIRGTSVGPAAWLVSILIHCLRIGSPRLLVAASPTSCKPATRLMVSAAMSTTADARLTNMRSTDATLTSSRLVAKSLISTWT